MCNELNIKFNNWELKINLIFFSNISFILDEVIVAITNYHNGLSFANDYGHALSTLKTTLYMSVHPKNHIIHECPP